MKRTALATWQGEFRTGTGSVTILNSGICDTPFSYHSRFEGELAMSPEGLLAAAHAASFSMSLALHLESEGLIAERIDVAATVSVEEVRRLETITCVALELLIRTDPSNHARVLVAARQAQTDCSISRLINAAVTLTVEFGKQVRSTAA